MKRSMRFLPALALLLPLAGCDNSGGPTADTKSTGTAGAPAGGGDSKTSTKGGKTGMENKPTAPN